MNEHTTVAIIPARGGSKGVVRKNLQPVGGIPLVTRAVRAALGATQLSGVYVSTDDSEIASVAEKAGASVVNRPADFAGDLASSESAVLHALAELDARGIHVSTVVFIQATSPFIDATAIDRGVRMVRDGTFDVVFSAHESYAFLWARDDRGHAGAINHDATHRPRRQDREPHYLETGAFYVMDAAGFRAAGHRFFGRVGIVEVSAETAIEIDDRAHLSVANALAPLVEVPEAIDVDAIVTDFDGVHTDDTAFVDADGHEFVRVSRSDGMGISLLRAAGIPLLILSTETNPVVTARARKLQVPALQGITDKTEALRAWAAEHKLRLDRIAYLGNDINDVPAMQLVGWPVAVADARPEVKAAARVTLTQNGGDGAVRELVELVLHPSRRGE
ncbi:cytidylyltransferase domain-containing protein (plasmid) [Coraliomargarita sp. W4R53]